MGLEFLALAAMILAVGSSFSAGWLWFESAYWRSDSKLKQEELTRVRIDLADAKEERDQWERHCLCQNVDTP